jgi:hypothetical protein
MRLLAMKERKKYACSIAHEYQKYYSAPLVETGFTRPQDSIIIRPARRAQPSPSTGQQNYKTSDRLPICSVIHVPCVICCTGFCQMPCISYGPTKQCTERIQKFNGQHDTKKQRNVTADYFWLQSALTVPPRLALDQPINVASKARDIGYHFSDPPAS